MDSHKKFIIILGFNFIIISAILSFKSTNTITRRSNFSKTFQKIKNKQANLEVIKTEYDWSSLNLSFVGSGQVSGIIRMNSLTQYHKLGAPSFATIETTHSY